MVSVRRLISKFIYQSFGDCTVYTNYNYTVIFIVILVLLQSLGTYLSFYFILFLLCGRLVQALFLFTVTRSGRLAEIKWSVCITKF